MGGLSLDPILEKPQGQKADPVLHELAKVLDFGIAKLKEAHIEDSKLRHMTLTGTGMVVGTPAYMSPEQARGMKGDQLDGRSDLYSLGVVMYQMLCGDLPLNADSVIGLLMAHIQTEPPPIRARRPDVPEPIARLVMSCLEKKPELRPSTGQALMEGIERWEEEPARRAREKAEAERRAAEEKAEQESQARLLGTERSIITQVRNAILRDPTMEASVFCAGGPGTIFPGASASLTATGSFKAFGSSTTVVGACGKSISLDSFSLFPFLFMFVRGSGTEPPGILEGFWAILWKERGSTETRLWLRIPTSFSSGSSPKSRYSQRPSAQCWRQGCNARFSTLHENVRSALECGQLADALAKPAC